MTEALVDLVLGIAAAVAHEADPEERRRIAREHIQREASKWAALVPQTADARADAIEAEHRARIGHADTDPPSGT